MIFEKYQATGNDFLLTKEHLENPSQTARSICDRHFGIGGDGLMVPEPSDKADIRMRYFNSDGSEAPMCGNGMRCFAKFVVAQKLIDTTRFTVETSGGLIELEMHADGDVSLALEPPVMKHDHPDVSSPTTTDEPVLLEAAHESHSLHILTLGTLHAISVVESLESIAFEPVGHKLSTHAFFPKDINVNFVRKIDDNTLEIMTYERGAGATLSCGTGVAASAVFMHRKGFVNKHVTVHVPGGTLQVSAEEAPILKGPAERIARIDYEGGVHNG